VFNLFLRPDVVDKSSLLTIFNENSEVRYIQLLLPKLIILE